MPAWGMGPAREVPAAANGRGSGPDDIRRLENRSRPVVIVGRFAGTYGVRGALRVRSYTVCPEDILSYQPWLTGFPGADTTAWRKVRPIPGRRTGSRLTVFLPGIGDRHMAETLAHQSIAVRRDDLPPPEPGQFYWCDLLGLAVYDEWRGFLGRVERIMPTGSNDVLCVRDDNREKLIPWRYGETVQSVDLAAGKISVAWREPE